MKLYRWQEEALRNWKSNGCKGIVDAVTGAGKTALALAAVRYLRDSRPGLKVKVVVPTVPLAAQWRQAMLREAACEEDIPGFFGGGQKDPADRSVLVYVINSARDSLARHIRSDLSMGYPVLVIYDECHHYQSKENRRIFDLGSDERGYLSNLFRLGLSATPFNDGENRILLSGIGPPVYRYGLCEAARDGVIAPFTVCQIAVDFTAPEKEAYAALTAELANASQQLRTRYPALTNLKGDAFFQAVTALAGRQEDTAAAYLGLCYQRKELSVSASARIGCCVDLIGRLHKRDRIIVFCERIPQAEKTERLIRLRFGDVCGLYHSRLSKTVRERILNSFRSGESRILVACRALDEGIDVPDANIGIVMSGSSVRRQRIQRIGRLLRKADGKSGACLYYCYVRCSYEDPVFLRGVDLSRSFTLQYDAADHLFSDGFYEYIARELITRAQARQLPAAFIREMRLCLLEGIGRADYLTDEKTLAGNRRTARTRHAVNYWTMMIKIRKILEGDTNHEL